MLGYQCGPSGVPIPKTGMYCIRPIYNLDGMSKGATAAVLKKGDNSTPPGYFWCEFFSGEHFSVDYRNDRHKRQWVQTLTVVGKKQNLYKFVSWKKINKRFPLPWLKNTWFDLVDTINVEYIGKKVIEIHLRGNPDFHNHNFKELLVVWESDGRRKAGKGWTFIKSEEDLGHDKRIGFYGK
jgi:hypothetical protein